MAQAHVRFYGSLNDFLSPEQRGAPVVVPFAGQTTVKDVVESAGVPHPEVGELLVNGEPAEFALLVQDGAQVSAYPDRIGLALLRPPLPRPVRFVLDVHLGRLAAYLRLAGFDTLYENNYNDPELARIAGQQNRVLLTRDVGLLKRSIVRYGYFVRATERTAQLAELFHRYELREECRPFRRCLHCNGLLEPVAKQHIESVLPPQVRAQHEQFHRCPQCSKVYWPGTHYQRMSALLAQAAAL